MCFNWRKKPEFPTYPYSSRILLTFAINDYPGTDNDLKGCLNDQALMVSLFPTFQARVFKNSQVTKAWFLRACEEALDQAQPGDKIIIHYSGHGTYVADTNGDEIDGYDEALYLFDGPLIDDRMNDLLKRIKPGVDVGLLMDCCFSESNTRNNDCVSQQVCSRFVRPANYDQIPHIRIKEVFATDLPWVVISGCQENETSADAFIPDLNMWYGIFSLIAGRVFYSNLTWQKWYERIRIYLPSKSFDQTPKIEGSEELRNKLVLI